MVFLVEGDDDDDLPRPAGSSADGIGGVSESSAPVPPHVPLFAPSEAASAKAGLTSEHTGTQPGTDTRGLGLETFAGRPHVRKFKGSTRPPAISGELLGMYSAKDKRAAIA
jgi:hypothetical protein